MGDPSGKTFAYDWPVDTMQNLAMMFELWLHGLNALGAKKLTPVKPALHSNSLY